MTSQELEKIKDLRDYAELAWVAYGYFYLVGKKFANKEEYKDRKDTEIIIHDILDSTYSGYIAMGKNRWGQDIKIGTLKGDFTPTQAKRFSERYELIHHIPNTLSGFSATIFYDIKESNTTTNTKEFKKHFEYIIAFRGTESTREIA